MTATAIRYSYVPALNLPRIGAWSTTLSIHAVALAMLLSAPVAYQLTRKPEPEKATAVRIIEEKTVPVVEDLKPPPQKPREQKHHVTPPAPPVTPVVHEESTMPSDEIAHDGPPVSLETGPVTNAPAEPDVGPTAIAYGTHASVAYPHDSLKAHEQGIVILRVLVDADGNVTSIEIEKSSGFARLDRAARDAVKSWRFNPAKHAGIAQSAWARVPINFNLSTL